MQKEMAYDEFVRKMFDQGPIVTSTAFYYDIALPDIDDVSVVVKTEFKVVSVTGIKKLIDHFRKSWLKPGEGDNTVIINMSVNYHEELTNLFTNMITDGEGSSEVSAMLLETQDEIKPLQ